MSATDAGGSMRRGGTWDTSPAEPATPLTTAGGVTRTGTPTASG